MNIYAPNVRASKYVKRTFTDLKGELHSNIIMVSDFKTPLSIMNRISSQKKKKEIADFQSANGSCL
jgi:hypothetical protein